jgi:hypothetical protein
LKPLAWPLRCSPRSYGPDAEGLLPLDLEAFVEQQLHSLSHAVEAVLREQLDRLVGHARMSLVGHGWFS